jgi:hypothetical protein
MGEQFCSRQTFSGRQPDHTKRRSLSIEGHRSQASAAQADRFAIACDRRTGWPSMRAQIMIEHAVPDAMETAMVYGAKDIRLDVRAGAVLEAIVAKTSLEPRKIGGGGRASARFQRHR